MKRRTIGAVAAIALCGCGGGGTSVRPAPLPGAGASGIVRFTLSMPSANVTAHGYRRPRDVSPATASISIVLASTNGAPPAGTQTPTIIDILPTSPQCTVNGGGSAFIVCTVSVQAPAGNDVFTAAAFSGADGSGAQLSSGAVSATVITGATTTAPLVLDGIPAGIQLGAASTILPVGAKHGFNLFVVATDAAGEAIVGSDPYASPLTLTVNDPAGATTLSHTMVTGPTASVDGTYDGTNVTQALPITIGASAQGVPAAAVTPVVLRPDNERGWVNGAHFVYAQTVTTGFVPVSGTPPPSTTTGATISDTISTGASLDGQTGLVHVDEVVRPSASPTAAPQTNDYYYAYGVGSSSAQLTVQLIGERIVTPLGSTQAIDEVQSDIVDELPETAGTTWNNPGAYTSNYVAAAGDPNPSQTYSAQQGSYSYENTYANGARADAIANLDGSGSYSYQYADDTTHAFDIGAPAAGGIGITESIIQLGGATTTQTATIPNWYPNGTFPQPPFSDVYTQVGVVSVPAACNVPSSIATTANEIDEAYAITDPLVGEILTQTRKSYIGNGIGRVCVLETDNEQLYYVLGSAAIESDGIPQIFVGSLLGTYVTTSSVGMQSTSAVSSARSRRP